MAEELTKNCLSCGKEFVYERSTAKYCSDTCRYHKHLANKKRITIPRDLRFSMLRRDGFRCRYCGATPEKRELRIDHIQSVHEGGALTDPDNLITSCDPCNAGKGSLSLDPAEIPALENPYPEDD